MFRYFIVSHYHKFFNQFLAVDSLFDTNIDWIVFLIQFEANLISIENLSISSGFPLFKSNFFHNFYFLNHLIQCPKANAFCLSKIFSITQSIIQHCLSFIIS